MPIYEYRCSACGYQNDYLQKISDPLLADCPECGKSTLVKQVTAAGFQLKGTGWYATDFKNNGTSKPAPAKSDSKGGPGAGGGSASSESSAKSGDSESKSGDSSGKSGESGISSSDSTSKPEKSAPAGASPAST
jgi:putative FmdB family regulatory protein